MKPSTSLTKFTKRWQKAPNNATKLHLTSISIKHNSTVILQTFFFSSTAIAFASFTYTAFVHSSSCKITDISRSQHLEQPQFSAQLIIILKRNLPEKKCIIYLCQGGYVFINIFLFVNQQDYAKNHSTQYSF